MEIRETYGQYQKIYRELYDETGNKAKINDHIIYELKKGGAERVGIFRGFKGAILLMGGVTKDETIHIGTRSIEKLWIIDPVRQKYGRLKGASQD